MVKLTTIANNLFHHEFNSSTLVNISQSPMYWKQNLIIVSIIDWQIQVFGLLFEGIAMLLQVILMFERVTGPEFSIGLCALTGWQPACWMDESVSGRMSYCISNLLVTLMLILKLYWISFLCFNIPLFLIKMYSVFVKTKLSYTNFWFYLDWWNMGSYYEQFKDSWISLWFLDDTGSLI